MKLIDVKVLRGPNFWSVKRKKLVQFTLDLEELEEKPTDAIPHFYERLQQLLPSLYEHECSEGHKGGFFERVKRGTWMGHVIEHMALELQSLAGIQVGFGRTRGTGKYGVYHMVYEYAEEKQGIYAGKAAIRLAEAIISGAEFDVQKEIAKIQELWFIEKPGPSSASLIEEAEKRNIPVIRLDNDALFQMGYGKKQKRIEATISCQTGNIAVDIAGDKSRTKQLLTNANIPVPNGEVISDVNNLREAIDIVGFPLVIKPLDGNHGKGATINVRSWEEAKGAFARAKKVSEQVIIERYITGKDFRILVVNNKFVAAGLRVPACVKGDGRHTIWELVELVNLDPRRGKGHDKVLTTISIDEKSMEMLAKNHLNLDSIPVQGQEVFLTDTANLSSGGSAIDCTEEVHPKNIRLFERVARTIGLDICGIDCMAENLSEPIIETGGAIIEVNAAPGFRMHLQPSAGKPRNVAEPVLDMLFPYGEEGRIPIVAITGTNGKTTTTRLVAHIAQQSGCYTGFTTTDGIYIDNELIYKGDCSGPGSAQVILKDPAIEFAVLETARGGLLRSGLGYDQCDTAIVTNVAEDHLGLNGIDTIEKLAKVKSVVPETVVPHGYAILNADDDLVYAMKDRVSCKVALFSLYSDNIRVDQHCADGGIAAYLENGYLILRIANHIVPVEEVKNVPITFNGKATFNIANGLAAILAAYTHKIKISTIRKALQTFIPSKETTPGRMNLFELQDTTILLDYAHNPHGVKALGGFIRTMEVEKKIGVITGVGDRRDEDIIALAEEAARIFDEVIIRHDKDLRGRSHEELDHLLTEGVKRVDTSKPISYIWCECEAVEKALETCPPRSLIVVLIEDFNAVTECVIRRQAIEQADVQRMKAAV